MAREKCGLLAVPRTLPVSLRISALQSSAVSSAFTLRLRYQQLSMLQLIVKSCKMPFVFSHVEYCDMHLFMDFAMVMHVLLLTNTKGVFPTEGFRLGVYFLVFARQCVRLVVFQVLLCSLKGRWYH